MAVNISYSKDYLLRCFSLGKIANCQGGEDV